MSIMINTPADGASGTSEMRGSLMDRLKASTLPVHQQTEELGFQQHLVRGALPIEAYIASLSQLLQVHEALDQQLMRLRATVPAIEGVMRERYVQVPYLKEDLAFFGIDPKTIEPLMATKAMVKSINDLAAAHPVALLGYLYVLEGSNNGGRMIAVSVRKTYKLPEGKGTRYLDPYGSEQRTLWKQFKEDMNSQSFTPDEEDAIVAMAHKTFLEIGQVYEELFDPFRTTVKS